MIDEDKLINSLEKANATFSRLIKLANEKFAETDKRIGVLEEENKALKQALNLNLADDFDLLLSYFISKDPFSDSFLINKGKNQGILKGMTVISSQKSLIGKIKEVYDDFSRVVLITDKTFSFPCKIQKESEESEDITGIAKGKGNFELFFDLIPQEKQVSPGQKVVTVSLDGEFPKGIFVGEIEAIEKSDLHPFQKAKINPNFDLGNLEVLFVVLNY